MDDLMGIGEALSSKVAEKAYDDAASKPAKQIGKLLEDVFKTVRLLSFPLQMTAAIQDQLENKLKNTSERVVNRVPLQRRIDPQVQIIGPIYEHIKYMDENSILYELFEELLARSIDNERIAEAHPSFIHIISQLSHDEAIILLELRNNDFDIVESFDIDREASRVVNRVIEKCTLPKERLLFPDNFEMNLDHLVSLGLVLLPEIKEDEIRDLHLHVGSRRYIKIHLTKEFGIFFVNACVPENGFRNK